MTALDSVLSALCDRVDAVADIVEREGADVVADVTRQAALGAVLARHARVLTAELRERAAMRADVRR